VIFFSVCLYKYFIMPPGPARRRRRRSGGRPAADGWLRLKAARAPEEIAAQPGEAACMDVDQ
jgi:hypothetical protein